MHFKFSKKMLYNPTKIWYTKDIPPVWIQVQHYYFQFYEKNE